jgi:hypothetical protein
MFSLSDVIEVVTAPVQEKAKVAGGCQEDKKSLLVFL